MYAVIDVETTGLDPRTHRVVEVAVVEADADGSIVEEWSSLVAAPGTDELGQSALHGITRAMLVGVPGFAELAPELLRRLAGRVVVGHVLEFDLAHLEMELRRAGISTPDLRPSGLCTRQLARRYLPPGPRTLSACCRAAGVRVEGAHTAIGDARAAAGLLRHFIAAGHSPEWEERLRVALALSWPEVIEPADARALARPRR